MTGRSPRKGRASRCSRLLDGFTTPAFVLNPATDFLAANTMANALFTPFEKTDNLARMTFLDPAARGFFVHWDSAAEAVVASLRHATGLDPDYRRLHGLVRSLAGASEEFAALWSAHAVHAKTRDAKEVFHQDVGCLSLTYQTFDVREAPGQQLVVYDAEPDSPSARSLDLLGSLHAKRRPVPAG